MYIYFFNYTLEILSYFSFFFFFHRRNIPNCYNYETDHNIIISEIYRCANFSNQEDLLFIRAECNFQNKI